MVTRSNRPGFSATLLTPHRLSLLYVAAARLHERRTITLDAGKGPEPHAPRGAAALQGRSGSLEWAPTLTPSGDCRIMPKSPSRETRFGSPMKAQSADGRDTRKRTADAARDESPGRK